MLSEHEQELVQAAVDGELDSAGRKAFELLLEGNPQARALHAELLRFTALVAAEPALEPPAGLASALSGKLRLQERRQKRESILAVFTSGWRYALAGVAAFAVFLLVYQARLGLDTPSSHLSLVATVAPAAGDPTLRNLEHRQYQDPAADFDLQLGMEGKQLLLEVRMRSDELLGFELDSSGTGLAVAALARQTSDLKGLSWSQAQGIIKGEGQGAHQLLIVLSPAPAQASTGPQTDEIGYRITRQGELLDAGSMKVPELARSPAVDRPDS